MFFSFFSRYEKWHPASHRRMFNQSTLELTTDIETPQSINDMILERNH